MGLDMYLDVRKSCYPKKGNGVIDINRLTHKIDDLREDCFGCSSRITITENVCYWRKANAIHGWFVNNCQDGKDNCRECYVSNSQLHNLYDICNGILNMLDGVEMTIDKDLATGVGVVKSFKFDRGNLAKMWEPELWNYNIKDDDGKIVKHCEEVLPPSGGFFFGSDNIDGGYIYDIVKTVLMLDRLFDNMKKWDDDKVIYDCFYCKL